MSTNYVFYPHGIYVSGVLTLTQLVDPAPINDFQDLVEMASGQVGPQFTGSQQAKPGLPIRTTQLKDLLDCVVAGGYNINRDLSAGNVDFEIKAGKNLNERELDAAALHVRARMQENAMVTIESITARQGSLAEAACRFSCIYNAATGNDPLVFTNTVPLSITSTVEHLFTLGPIKLNGSFVEGVEEATLDNRVEYEVVYDGGFGFPSYCAVKTYNPQVRFTTRNSRVMNTYGPRGTALSALSLFFRKELRSKLQVADATLEHIAITAAVGTIKARALGQNIGAEVTIDLEMPSQNTAAYDVDTTAAIA